MNNNNIIQKEKLILVLVNQILTEQIRHSDISSVSITRVSLTNDYDKLELFYDTTKKSAALEEALNSIIPIIKKNIASTLNLRRVPVHIKFSFDKSLEKQRRLDDIFDKINKK